MSKKTSNYGTSLEARTGAVFGSGEGPSQAHDAASWSQESASLRQLHFSNTTPAHRIRSNVSWYSGEPSSSQYSVCNGAS